MTPISFPAPRPLVSTETPLTTVTIAPSGGGAYPVVIGEKLSPEAWLNGREPLVIHDRRLKPRWAKREWPRLAVPSGEPCKSFAVFRRVIDFVIRRDTGKPLLLVAFGGGSVGDLTGFAAASYRRGVPFLQMPTTLLAMVDASVGGKTAINHPRAKNMIGAFHQPVAVVADLRYLRTLPRRELRSGLAEVVKHGLIADAAMTARLEREAAALAAGETEAMRWSVEKSVRIKGRVVAEDERETRGVREILNFGHTLGHAIEAVRNFRGLTHGEAVAVGMAAAAFVSEKLLGFEERERLIALLAALDLPVRLRGESARKLVEATRRDKKRQTGRLRMTLLRATGAAVVVDGVDENLLYETARTLGAGR